MAAPSVNLGLTTLREMDFGFPPTSWVVTSGTENTSRQSNSEVVFLTSIPNTTSTQWIEINFTSTQNLTNDLIVFSFASQVNTNNLQIGLVTTSNTAYRVWSTTIAKATTNRTVVIDPANPTGINTGSFNAASVIGIRFQWVPTSTVANATNSGFAFGTDFVSFRKFIYRLPKSGFVLSNGEVGNTAGPAVITDALNSTLFNFLNNDPLNGGYQGFGNFIQTPISIVLNTALFTNKLSVFTFMLNETVNRAILGQENKVFTVNTTAVQTFIDLAIADEGNSGFIFFDISSHANIYRRLNLLGSSSVNLSGKTFTTLIVQEAKGTVSGTGTLSNLTLNSSASVAFRPSSSLAISGVNEITGSANHYISIESSGGWVNGNTFNATSFTFGTPATRVFRVDVGAGNTVNINVASGSGLSLSDVTVVSGIAVVNVAALTLTLVNLVAGSRVYIQNTSDDVNVFNVIEPTTTFSGAVPASKNLLIRVRNASGATKYKPFSTTLQGITSSTTLTINQELDQ